MPDITDKFGRPSAGNSYALATTVKTARLPSESVLECFDLSRFAQDTPVFGLTYKKVVDPVTNAVSTTSQISWKAVVNIENNSLVNFTVAPGYTDVGNEVGDYVECIPTSFWGNELIDALLGTHNPDGSLKPVGSVQTVDANDVSVKFSIATDQPEPDPDGKPILWFQPIE